MKKTLFIFFFISSVVFAQLFRFGEAKGLFMSVGVGPKVPIGTFSENRNLGVGFDVAFSYTDNKFLPVFLYTKFGFQHFPGRQSLYKRSDYSSFSTNMIYVSPGIRMYFPPLFNEEFILLPTLEGGLSWALFENYHQFKVDRNRENFVEEESKFGFHVGAGFSMFLLDVMTYYNFFLHNQFLSFDLRVRIPIFVKV